MINGDGHYDVLSGLQKSIRGSDVDASLHYAARLVIEGDLDSLFRRLSVIAYEDIGLANPNIYPRLEAAINAAERVGLPEARIPIGTIVTEMALSPKSNTAHIAFDEALKDIEEGNVGKIPNHIKTEQRAVKAALCFVYSPRPNICSAFAVYQFIPSSFYGPIALWSDGLFILPAWISHGTSGVWNPQEVQREPPPRSSEECPPAPPV